MRLGEIGLTDRNQAKPPVNCCAPTGAAYRLARCFRRPALRALTRRRRTQLLAMIAEEFPACVIRRQWSLVRDAETAQLVKG